MLKSNSWAYGFRETTNMNTDQNTVDSTEPAQRNPGPDQNQEEAGSELREHGKFPLGGAWAGISTAEPEQEPVHQQHSSLEAFLAVA